MYKKLICLFLCLGLALAGCGGGEPTPEITRATEVPTNAYLSVAEGLAAEGNYAAAIGMLEELPADPEILACLERLRQVDITAALSDDLTEGSVEIHSYEALRQSDGTIRYRVEFTATEGMTVILMDLPGGENLNSPWPQAVSGQRQELVFSLTEADALTLPRIALIFDGGRFRLDLTHPWAPSEEASTVQVTGQAEGIPQEPGTAIGWQSESQMKTGTVTVHGCQVWTLENGSKLYALDYTAPVGMTVQAFDPPNGERLNVRREESTSGQRETFLFEANVDPITVSIQDAGLTEGYYVFLNGHTLPITVTDSAAGEAADAEISTSSHLQGSTVEIHSFVTAPLANGGVRHTMDYTAPAGMSLRIGDPPDAASFCYTASEKTDGTRQTLTFDITGEEAASIPFLQVLFYFEDRDQQFFVTVRTPHYGAETYVAPAAPAITPVWE